MTQAVCTRVDLDKCVTDGRYQRQLDERRVEKIVRNFDPKILGTLEVSERADGTFAVIDGQHRFAALKAKGRKQAPALVHKNLDAQQEADLFARLNMTRKPLSAVQRFKAQLFSGDERATDISRIVTDAGFRIIEGGASIGDITAVAALERSYKAYGADTLATAMKNISDLWYGEESSVTANMISGFTQFLSMYGDRYDERHAEKLRRVPSQMIVRRAQEKVLGGSQYSTATAVAEELRRVTGLRGTSGRRDTAVVSKATSESMAIV